MFYGLYVGGEQLSEEENSGEDEDIEAITKDDATKKIQKGKKCKAKTTTQSRLLTFLYF